VWVNTLLLQVLHANWPEEMQAGKIKGIQGEVMTSSDSLTLRKQNVNFGVTMADSTVYLGLGGGIMASGKCLEDVTNCDRIFAELRYWQQIVKSNSARFRTALNWPAFEELCIRMRFDNRDCWLYEATTGTTISLIIEPPG
jgi:hypothetical protein